MPRTSETPVLVELVVTDLKSLERWLVNTPMADSAQACFELTTLLEDLETHTRPPAQHHQLLERLQQPVQLALEEHTKRFSGRPLPLRDGELAAFDQVFDLWTAYGRGYRRLALATSAGGDSHPLSPHLPALLCRALECLDGLMLAHYRARRELSGDHWQDLHELYTIGETLGIDQVMLDPTARRPASVRERYVRALLVHLAAPYSMSLRELDWTVRWSRSWAGKVELASARDGGQALSIDLDADRPPRPGTVSAGPSVRVLGTAELRKSLRKRLRGLEAGMSPVELGLGKDVEVPLAKRLLATLQTQWIDTETPRMFKRRLVNDRADVATGFHNIHMAVGGRLARAPKRVWDYSRRDTEKLLVYGKIDLDFTERDQLACESWDQLDESANGFRLARRGPGARLAHQQLVALRPNDAPAFILAEVRWLSEQIDRAITIGVRALPGIAQPISARIPPEDMAMGPEFEHAFVLPATAGSAPSLILPPQYFRLDRVIELRYEENVQRVRLRTLVSRGHDFERVAFEILG